MQQTTNKLNKKFLKENRTPSSPKVFSKSIFFSQRIKLTAFSGLTNVLYHIFPQIAFGFILHIKKQQNYDFSSNPQQIWVLFFNSLLMGHQSNIEDRESCSSEKP